MRYGRQFVSRLEGPFVDKWPVGVMFQLPLLLPISILFLAAGVLMASATPIVTPSENAVNLLEGDRREKYLIALLQLHIECKRDRPQGADCIQDGSRFVDEQQRVLRDEISRAALTDCRVTALRSDDTLGSDVFVCDSAPEPSPAWAIGFGSLVALSILGGIVALSRALSYRSLLPRFNPRLWITPGPVLVILVVTAPALASVVTLLARDPIRSWSLSQLAPAMGIPLLLFASVVSATLVADLRTFEPERTYGVGILVLAVLGVAAAVFFALVDGISRGNSASAVALLATVAWLIIVALAARFLWTRPRRASVVRSTLAFARRWLLLNIFTILAVIVHFGPEVRARLWVQLTTTRLVLALILINVVWSLVAERLIQTRHRLAGA